jgi:hypothetical protein
MKPSVSEILKEEYNISARPGASKIECPFCHKNTFSIHKNDVINRCFHPSCERFVSLTTESEQNKTGYYRVMMEIFFDFHKALMDQKKNRKNNDAYSYLVKERQIHPQVVADSMLGVIPLNYDLNVKFDPVIEKIAIAVKDEQDSRKEKCGRPKKSEKNTEADLEFIKEAKEKLSTCINNHAGWLAFFYTNKYHNIVAIRFRKSYSKEIIYFKPSEQAGLFGHGLFRSNQLNGHRALISRLIVTEGEFNQLQLQSLCLRYEKVSGKQIGYLFACAVGGVSTADHKTIHMVDPAPIFCYDNDVSNAGFELVKNAQQYMNFMAFTTPKPDSDLDEFICSFDKDYKAAWEVFKFIIDEGKPYYRDYKSVAKEIYEIRLHGGGLETNTKVAEIIRNDLKEKGKFYQDGKRSYFFFVQEKKLIEINPDNSGFNLMLDSYGINKADNIYKYLVNDLYTKILREGEETNIYRLAYYKTETFTLYLFNHKNQIYRISPETIDLVDNGTDGILFLIDPRYQPFEVSEPNKDSSWLDKILLSKINLASGQLTPDEQRLIFTLWFYSIFFENIMSTKPILTLVGEKGSSKSITARKVGKILFGEAFNTSVLGNKIDDFDAAVTNSAYVAFDNVDTAAPEWFDNRLSTVSTGQTVPMRILYTTNDLIDVPTHCFLAITSRTPEFRREDVADRLLIMKTERFKKFKSENKLLTQLMRNRDQIMSEVVCHLQEVVRALRDGKKLNYEGPFRMADFANFALKIAHHAGTGDRLRVILGKLACEQTSFAQKVDPVIDLFMKWVRNNQNNYLTNPQLREALTNLAKSEGIKFVYNHENDNAAFGQKMKTLRPELKKIFTIDERPVAHGYTAYRYTFKEEAKKEKTK